VSASLAIETQIVLSVPCLTGDYETPSDFIGRRPYIDSRKHPCNAFTTEDYFRIDEACDRLGLIP